MYFPGKIIDVLVDEPDLDKTSESYKSMCRIAMLCNRAVFLPDQSEISINYRVVIGDASETAVLKFMERIQGETAAFRAKHPKVTNIIPIIINTSNDNFSFAKFLSIRQINFKCQYINSETIAF